MGIIYKLMKHRNLTMNLNKPHKNTKIKSDLSRLITIEGNIIETPLHTSADSAQEDLTKTMDSHEDKQFTAEHIIQLCKFLAEKSKRNKNLYKQQQSPKKPTTKSKESQFLFQSMDYDDNEDEVDFYPNEALPLLSKQRLQHLQQQNNANDDNDNQRNEEFEQQTTSVVLSTRLSPDINSLNISTNTTTATSCALQHYQQQQQHQKQQQQQQHIYNYQPQHQLQSQPAQNQGKRDILLKIRRQIFERKRLRENGAFEPQEFNNSQVWRPW